MKKKTIALLLVMVLIFGISVGGTIAYLTDTKTVTNTFTVGNVHIKLDEAKTNLAGEPLDGSNAVVALDKAVRTEVGNKYHLIPGMSYTKDPTITVLAGSEKAYVRMQVTVSKSAELDAIFGPGGADMTAIFGALGTGWVYKNNVEDTAKNIRTYEFWYTPEVDDSSDIPALFQTITVPGVITNDQLATLVEYNTDGTIKSQMTITAVAHAIQSAGFADAAAAWAAWTN